MVECNMAKKKLDSQALKVVANSSNVTWKLPKSCIA